MSYEREEFLDRIRTLCKSRGISYHNFTEATGLSRSVMYGWVNTSKTPSLASVITLAEFFGVSVDYLLFGTSKSEAEQVQEKDDTFYKQYKSLSNEEQAMVRSYTEALYKASLK